MKLFPIAKYIGYIKSLLLMEALSGFRSHKLIRIVVFVLGVRFKAVEEKLCFVLFQRS